MSRGGAEDHPVRSSSNPISTPAYAQVSTKLCVRLADPNAAAAPRRAQALRNGHGGVRSRAAKGYLRDEHPVSGALGVQADGPVEGPRQGGESSNKLAWPAGAGLGGVWNWVPKEGVEDYGDGCRWGEGEGGTCCGSCLDAHHG